MLQDQIMDLATEMAGANNWITAANAIMAAGKISVAKLEVIAGDGDDTGVLPVAEMLEAADKAASYACGKCRKMSTCPNKCSVNLFLADLENLLKAK